MLLVAVVAPFDQLYWYGGVPPETLAVMLPSLFPQVDEVVEVVTAIAAGSVIEYVAVVLHDVGLLTVTVYDPAPILLSVALVCTGVVFQL